MIVIDVMVLVMIVIRVLVRLFCGHVRMRAGGVGGSVINSVFIKRFVMRMSSVLRRSIRVADHSVRAINRALHR